MSSALQWGFVVLVGLVVFVAWRLGSLGGPLEAFMLALLFGIVIALTLAGEVPVDGDK